MMEESPFSAVVFPAHTFWFVTVECFSFPKYPSWRQPRVLPGPSVKAVWACAPSLWDFQGLDSWEDKDAGERAPGHWEPFSTAQVWVLQWACPEYLQILKLSRVAYLCGWNNDELWVYSLCFCLFKSSGMSVEGAVYCVPMNTREATVNKACFHAWGAHSPRPSCQVGYEEIQSPSFVCIPSKISLDLSETLHGHHILWCSFGVYS